MSGLPQDAVDEVVEWCQRQVPAHLRDEMRVECDVAPRHLTIVEARPPWDDGGPEWIRHPYAQDPKALAQDAKDLCDRILACPH